MRPPPRWLRRALIDPAFVAGVVLAATTLPLVVVAAAFISRYVPGKWRVLRIVWYLFFYLAVNALAVVVMFGFWLASGLGWKLRTPYWQDAHYRLLRWMLRRLVASAKTTFKVSLIREGPSPRTMGAVRSRRALVLSRHAGPGDSILLMDGLANQFKRNPRIVLKELLQWDPAIDVILNRLPSAFVPPTRGGEVLLRAISEMAATMDVDDAFVIFPEGGNYTRKRHLRSIEKLREIGRPDLAERAASLQNTLPPRSTGVKTALAAAPPDSDVFFVGHAGLETFESMGDIWRGMPMGTEVDVKIWHVPAEEIPPPEDQETWLFDIWAEIDAWITDRLERTAEPFDDPDEY
ncbi:MAG: lysophospholipid acyltransferase family protein [Acidimicrobiia bacterium]